MNEEIWKDVVGYDGLYQVSNLGRVKSLAKKAGKSNRCEKILSQNRVRGYCNVRLSKNAKCNSFGVHRLVALTFIPNPEDKPEVNHINGIKDDNRVENLEWVTSSENRKHMYRVLGYKSSNFGKTFSVETREKIGRYHSKKVICVELNKTFNSASEASRWLGFEEHAVIESIRKKRKCGGCTWKYCEGEI